MKRMMTAPEKATRKAGLAGRMLFQLKVLQLIEVSSGDRRDVPVGELGRSCSFRCDGVLRRDVSGIGSVFSRIIGVDVKGDRQMYRRLTGDGMRIVAAGAVLAVGVAMTAAPMAMAQSSPIPHAHIYPDVQAAPDIRRRWRRRAREHKRAAGLWRKTGAAIARVLNYIAQEPNEDFSRSITCWWT